jgi:hypothetical protein
MVMSAAATAERVGPAFSVDGMLLARQKTRQAVQDISVLIEPGMVEEDAVALAKKTLVNSGLELSWHPTRVRFGINTIKPMKQAYLFSGYRTAGPGLGGRRRCIVHGWEEPRVRALRTRCRGTFP